MNDIRALTPLVQKRTEGIQTYYFQCLRDGAFLVPESRYTYQAAFATEESLIKQIPMAIDGNQLKFGSDQLLDLPAGVYKLEVWEIIGNAIHAIYPSDRNMRFRVLSNSLDLPTGKVSSLTLDEFIDRFNKAIINGGSIDLTSYVKTDELKQQLAGLNIPKVSLDPSNRVLTINGSKINIPDTVDLSNYVTTDELPKVEYDADKHVLTINGTQVDLPANVDLSNYYNKSEVDDKLSKVATGEAVDLTSYLKVADADKKYATKQELPDVSDLAKKSDLDDYAKKAMVPVISLDAEARKLTLNGTEINIPATVDLSGYATKQELPKITYDQATKSLTINGTKIELPSNVDLSGYYTKSEVDGKLAQAASDGKVDLTGYLTKTDASKTYATKSELPDLTDYAKMSDLPSITDLVKKSELANYATKDDLKTVTSNANRRAPMGYTLDRTTNPWTIWFDNGCGLQFPNYGTAASLYGYGFYANEQNTSLVLYPLTGVVMSASHGTLTLDTISKKTDNFEYWALDTKVINPVRTDADGYDWSNVYFNDESRAKKGQNYTDRQRVMLRVMYELGIWSIDDIKPFGLTKKEG